MAANEVLRHSGASRPQQMALDYEIMLIQVALIFAFLAVGELVVWLTAIPVPSSIIGMILLTIALQSGKLKLQRVEGFANFLTRNMGFFFVPAGIGVMRCLDIISQQWAAIVTATIVSTFIIIAVTGWVHQICRRTSKRHA